MAYNFFKKKILICIEAIKAFFLSKDGFKLFFISLFLVGSWGPILSFYSLQAQSGYSWERSLAYGVVTFVLDGLNVLLLAFSVKWLCNNEYLQFRKALSAAVFIYFPIWLSDVVDLNQSLRVLSNIGLFVSFLFLYSLCKGKVKNFLILLLLHIIFYALNAAVAEMIALNPLLLRLIR
ncbi:hypothetical protein [Desulfurobacterium sp.]